MEEEKKEERKEFPLTEPKRLPMKIDDAPENQEQWLEPKTSVNKYSESLKKSRPANPKAYLQSIRQESEKAIAANISWQERYSSQRPEQESASKSRISFNEEAEGIEVVYGENIKSERRSYYKTIEDNIKYNMGINYYQQELEKIGVPYSKASHRIAKKVLMETYESTEEFVAELEGMGIKRETTEPNIKTFFYHGYDEVKQFLPSLINGGVEPDRAKQIHDKLFDLKYETPETFLSDLVKGGLDEEKAKEHTDFFMGFLDNKKNNRSFIDMITNNECEACIIL